MNSRSTLLAGGALIFSAAALVGWKITAGNAVPAAPSAAAKANASSRTPRPARDLGPPAEVAKQMELIRQAGSQAERIRATIALATSLSTEKIADWMEASWFNVRGGCELIVFTTIVMERWREAAPEQIARWRFKNGERECAEDFSRWMKSDPLAVREFLKSQPKDGKYFELLGAIAKKEPALAVEVFRNLKEDGLQTSQVRNMEGSFFQGLAEGDPAALEQLIKELPDDSRKSAEPLLYNAKLKKSFSSALQELIQRPDGWNIFYTSSHYDNGADFSKNVLAELRNFPDDWKAQLVRNGSVITYRASKEWFSADLESMGFTKEQANSIRAQSLVYSVNSDPDAALETLNKSDFTTEQRQQVVSQLSSYLLREPGKADSLLAKLSPEERQMVETQLERNRSYQSAQEIRTASEWLDQVAKLDENSNQSYRLSSILRNLDSEQLEELHNSFATMPDETKKKMAETLISGGNYGGTDMSFRGDLISYLVSQPEAKPDPTKPRYRNPNSTIASDYAVQLGQDDPVAASTWVQNLPEGDSRSWAQKNLAAVWTQYDPDAANGYIQTLPAAAQAEIRQFVGNRGRPSMKPRR